MFFSINDINKPIKSNHSIVWKFLMYPPDLTMYLQHIQRKMVETVIPEDRFNKLDKIAGADVSFSKNDQAVAAAVLLDLKTLKVIEKETKEVELFFPYVSEFLGFRETDAIISVVKKLNNKFDVLMVNGHGMLHPRGFGLASQVGVLLDEPTLGVAKRLIKGSHIKSDVSSPQLLKYNNQEVGAYINGNYVSIGHRLSLNTVIDLILKTSRFRMPEPLRMAHELATKTFKQKLLNDLK